MKKIKASVSQSIYLCTWLGFFWVICVHLFVKADIKSLHWLSIVIFILPQLYLGLFLFSVIPLLHERNLKTIGLSIFTSAFAFAIWFPAKLKINNPPLTQLSYPSTLKLMTWNVGRVGELSPSHFSSLEKQQAIDQKLDCILALLQSKKVDVIAFQEISQVRIKDLKNKLEIKCRSIDYFGLGQDGLGGLAICIPNWSKWELLRTKSLPVLGKWRILFSEIKHQQSNQYINILNLHFTPPMIAFTDLPPFKYNLYKVMHQTLNHLENQDTQYQNILKLLSGFKDPTLLLGDFNSPPEAKVHQSLKQEWVDVWAFNGTGTAATKYFGNVIPFRIDFIYAKRQQWDIKDSEIIPHYCSDHLPVYSELLLIEK
jgi:exonuclease III